MDELEALDDGSGASCFFCFQHFFFLSLLFLIDLLELLSFKKLDLFDDESDYDGSGSRPPGTYAFPFCSVKSVGSVSKYDGGVSGIGSSILFQLESSQMVTLFRCSCLYQEESIPKVVDS